MFVVVPVKEAMRLAFLRSISVSMEFWGSNHNGRAVYPDLMLLETGDEAALPIM